MFPVSCWHFNIYANASGRQCFLKECCGHDSLPKLESISLFGEAMCLGRLWPYLLVNLIVLTPVRASFSFRIFSFPSSIQNTY